MSDIRHISCEEDVTLLEVLRIFEEANLYNLTGGIALVRDESGLLKGTVSEGDVRRALLKGRTMESPVKDVMQNDPITFAENLSMKEILEKIPDELSRRN